MAWRVDEGLAKLTTQWRTVHRGAIVYFIGDSNHSTDPDVTQHAPDDGGPAPGDDLGEVDAGDFMPGNGVTQPHLRDLWNDLRDSRDPRILYAIYGDEIFSSVVRPWEVREYRGPFHSHVHLSVNDKYNANTDPWNLGGPDVPRKLEYVDVKTRLPILVKGDEDGDFTGYDQIGRLQALMNWAERANPLELDGVYGAHSAAKLARIMKTAPTRTTPNGTKVALPEYRRLHGFTA